MNIIMLKIFDIVQAYDYNSPVSFLIVLVGILAMFRLWGIIGLIICTFTLAYFAHDWIVMNIVTLREVISVPIFIYSAGAVITTVAILFSFLKFMLR